MDVLPEYFGVFRPGYGFHTYMILVKNTQRIVDEIRWNSLENISIDETILMPATVPIQSIRIRTSAGINNKVMNYIF